MVYGYFVDLQLCDFATLRTIFSRKGAESQNGYIK